MEKILLTALAVIIVCAACGWSVGALVHWAFKTHHAGGDHDADR